MKNGELIDMQSIEYTKDEILMCQHVLHDLANTNLEDLHTGVLELIGEDDQGREGRLEVNFQEYAAKAAAILGSVTATPDVQGEPVGWESIDGLPHDPDEGELFWFARSDGYVEGPRRIQPCGYDYDEFEFFRPVEPPALYTTPQPAEQQPDPTDEQIIAITTAYEQGVGKGHEALCRGEEIQNPYGASWGCDKAWQLGYEEGIGQQPAPDVTELVEALESLLEVQDEDCRYDHQGYCQNHNLDHIDDGCRVAKAKTALAAHRKGDSK